jgi:hypothetical protein
LLSEKAEYEPEGDITDETAQHKIKDQGKVSFGCPAFAGDEGGQEGETIGHAECTHRKSSQHRLDKKIKGHISIIVIKNSSLQRIWGVNTGKK